MNLTDFKPKLHTFGQAITLCASALLLSACGSDDDTQHDISVSLNHGGSIEGLWYNEEENGPRKFLGIPYGEAPIGNLRFTPPQAASWEGTIETQAFGASCLQNPGALSAAGDLSEDCLSLNVFTPEMEDGEKNVPVMVWIHGGAFLAGSSNQYNAINLAKDKNVIVVTLNYRLGALGFFSHPLVDAEQGQNTGNLGLQDQQLAMQWVKDNIDEFGGDSNNITIFGESAGSMSTCVQMVAPASQDLANRFILQSGSCVGGGLAILPKSAIEAVSAGLANTLCPEAEDTLACLRELPAEDITAYGSENGTFGQGWGPTIIDGHNILPDSPANLIASGEFNDGGLILGTNLYEWSLFQALTPSYSVSSIEEFNAYVDDEYPANQAAALKVAYAPTSDALANVFLSTLVTDQIFRCPTRSLANLAADNDVSVWLYSFEQNNPAHAYEIPYVFNYVSAPLGIDPTDSPTTNVFQSYWSTFAKTGNPNDNEQPDWPNYDASTQAYMVLKDSPEADIELSKAACDLWDSFN